MTDDAGLWIGIIGNNGGSKSMLARALARHHDLPRLEIDEILWTPAWDSIPDEDYDREHDAFLARDRWLIDGMGRIHSIALRLKRATWIVLTDFPLWKHFWLAIERQIAWLKGEIESPPGGYTEPPSTWAIWENIGSTETDLMPEIRRVVEAHAQRDKRVTRLDSVDALKAFVENLG